MKSCLYVFPDRVVICSQSQIQMGMWIATPPFYELTIESSDDYRLVDTLFLSLQHSKTGLALPDIKENLKLFYKALRVRTNKELHETGKLYSVTYADNILTITPCRNLGYKQGFEPINDEDIRITDVNDKNLVAHRLKLAIAVSI